MKKTSTNILLGLSVMALLTLSSLLVAAISTGKGPLEMLFPVDEKQAVYIAQQQVEGVVQEVEIETINNVPVYEVDIRGGGTEIEVAVDAYTGDVVSVEEEEEDTPITGSALDRASAAALKHIGEGRVTDTEVGDEEGYYEIEITKNNGREVDVHLDKNFNILSVEED
jgi:uncharacterized membrane protein YkoI